MSGAPSLCFVASSNRPRTRLRATLVVALTDFEPLGMLRL
jgi:hypothetical protein